MEDMYLSTKGKKKGEQKNGKNNNLNDSVKKFCNYCNYPYKKGKLVKCTNCEKYFCKQCLTDVGKRTFFCVSCCINMLRYNVDLLVVNDSSMIKKKRTIKIPMNRYKGENDKNDKGKENKENKE